MSQELPDTVAAFDDAQRRSIAMLRDITQRLEAGMRERDVFELAETRLQPHGFDRWYHAPEIRIGGRVLAGPLPSLKRPKLEPGSLIAIDIGPASADVYGDIGCTLHFGDGPEPDVVRVARDCVKACCGYASRWKTVGEIQIFAAAWAVNNRMELAGGDSVGHRVLPKDGLLATGFPRSAHAATLLARNRVHRLNPVRMDGMFAIRPVLDHRGAGAWFEEIVYIHEDTRKVLGRDSYEECGTL